MGFKFSIFLSYSNEGRRYRATPNFPARFRPSDIIEFGSDERVSGKQISNPNTRSQSAKSESLCVLGQARYRVKVIRSATGVKEGERTGILQEA